jgi:hypothetical protein
MPFTLDQTCGADKALRAQVERLLALSQTAGDFFKDCAPSLEPAPADAAQVLSAAESAVEPEIPETKRIGPYKLLQKLGEGGAGWFIWRSRNKRFAAGWR